MAYTPMELAHAFLQTGELNDAIEAVNTQLKDHPQDEDALRLRGSLYLATDDPDKAMQDYLTLSEHNASDLVILSIIAERMEDAPKAIQYLRDSLAMEFEEHTTERLILLLHVQEQFDEALTLLETLPDEWRWNQWRGDTVSEMQDNEAAVTFYQKAIDQLKQSNIDEAFCQSLQVRLYFTMGHALARLKRYDESVAAYEAGQTMTDDDTMIQYHIGVNSYLAGHPDKAQKVLRDLLNRVDEDERQIFRQLLDDCEPLKPLWLALQG